jgi:hypothetical protein
MKETLRWFLILFGLWVSGLGIGYGLGKHAADRWYASEEKTIVQEMFDNGWNAANHVTIGTPLLGKQAKNHQAKTKPAVSIWLDTVNAKNGDFGWYPGKDAVCALYTNGMLSIIDDASCNAQDWQHTGTAQITGPDRR